MGEPNETTTYLAVLPHFAFVDMVKLSRLEVVVRI